MEWISVTEELPEANQPVILFTPFDFFGELHSCVGNVDSIKNCTVRSGREKAPVFTHWLPLPQTPLCTNYNCKQ